MKLDQEARYAENHEWARWDGDEWNIETVDGPGVDRFTKIELELDRNGYPHISYHDESNNSLIYTYWAGSDWTIQTVDTGVSDNCSGPSLALDGNDYPHISYVDDKELQYAVWDGAAWQVQFVDNEFYSTYEKLHEEIKSGKRDKVSVEDIGGIECMKCHY